MLSAHAHTDRESVSVSMSTSISVSMFCFSMNPNFCVYSTVRPIVNFLNLNISDHISIHEQYYTDLTTENESSALGQEVDANCVTSHDVIGPKWLPEKVHLQKYVSHSIFEIYLVKSLNYMPVYYIIWRNFCAS